MAKEAEPVDMNVFPVSLAITSRSDSFITGAFSFSITTNLDSFPKASSLVGPLILTAEVTVVPPMFF